MKNQMTLVFIVVCLMSCVNAAIVNQGNGYFTIYGDNETGVFTIATGPNHPVGSGRNVLFGGSTAEPLSSYVSLYSKNSDTTYVNSEIVENATTMGLTRFESYSNIGSTGFRSYYGITGADEMTVVVTITVFGSTYETSSVDWNVQISNDGNSDLTVGVRFLWDFAVAEDDGPTFQTIVPTSGKFEYEKEYTNIFFKEYSMEGNRPNSAYFQILAAADGPIPWDHSSSPKISKLEYTSWQSTFDSPFFYSPSAENIAVNYTSLTDDSCVIIFWGDQDSNLKTISAGNTYQVANSFSVEPTQTPEQAIADCADNYTCTYDYINFLNEFTFDCLFIPMNGVCDDANPCTNDFCDPHNYQASDLESGCVFLEKDCSDQISCTIDACNVTTGECEHYALECNDEVDCTRDLCDLELGECTNTPADDYCLPQQTDLCHNYYCDKHIGCFTEDIICDDDIQCTVDTCNPAVGCIHTPVSFLCDDNITCTDDVCDADIGKCVNIPNNARCDDYDGCTTDLCDINMDCVFVPVDCSDAEMTCTQDICLNGTCLHIALDNKCDDNNNCTIDTCDMLRGDCTNVPADDLCDDDQWCTIDHCDEELGCVFTLRNCDDEIACTDDYCDFYTQKCVHSVANETLYCDDQIDCTVDTCDLDLGRCNHQADDYLCDDNDMCTTDICQKGAMGCVHIEKYCNDQLACTNDTCVAGECRFDPIDDYCDDGFGCTVDSCSLDVGRCQNIPTNALCDDDVACTLDICNYTHCLHIARDSECEDDIPCTINVCKEDGCYLSIDEDFCDDGLDCTIDYCDPDFGCRYILNHTTCEDDFLCTENICDQQVGCIVKLHDEVCDDGIDCSADTCDEHTGCGYEYRDNFCNDDVGCTVDTCNPVTGCDHVGLDSFCDDGRNCSTEYCDLDYGCVINDTSCPIDEDCEHCINCKSSLTRIVVNDLEDGSGDLLFNTRNIAVAEYSIASPTEGIVDNLLIKGAGSIVLGDEEFLDSQDGLVIGTASQFRLVPSSEQLPACNDVTRGFVQIISEWEGIDLADHMYICLQSDSVVAENSYQWNRIY